MSAEPFRPAAPPAGTGADLYVETTCSECAQPVRRVRTRKPGEWVALDGRDPDGAWWATKVCGQWRWVRPEEGEEPPSGGHRYREHGCREPVQQVRRFLLAALGTAPTVVQDFGNTAGACAGGCGTRVTKYGPCAAPLCVECVKVLEEWRKSPGPHRGLIPYGRLVDGVYQHHRDATSRLAP